jgi:glucose-6-phosphate isomerase
MISISLDISKALPFLAEGAVEKMADRVRRAHEQLLEGSGRGNDFLGWIRLPSEVDDTFLERIESAARQIAGHAEVIVVVGIGGSYLGARAVIEALQHSFRPMLKQEHFPLVLFAGENLSEDYHADLLDLLQDKSWAVIVISKSGTTTEPAVAFRILKKQLESKYGRKGASGRIIAVTDSARGALKKIADEEGYASFVIPDDVGGRYSVLTPVGLLPIAAAGFDIHELTGGAVAMQDACMRSADFALNPAALYAATRNLLLSSGKTTEILVTYQPQLVFFAEWWKQLYGESEGKEGKGIYPSSVTFTSDLHSMGQYIQEGMRNIFETVLSVERPRRELVIPADPGNPDGLDFLAGKRFSEVNRQAEHGTVLAHIDGGVPNIRVSVPCISEHNLGELIYFYEYACGLSGYLLGINPFDQPGVEAYKKNMFALLGKPGYEKEGERLRARLGGF